MWFFYPLWSFIEFSSSQSRYFYHKRRNAVVIWLICSLTTHSKRWQDFFLLSQVFRLTAFFSPMSICTHYKSPYSRYVSFAFYKLKTRKLQDDEWRQRKSVKIDSQFSNFHWRYWRLKSMKCKEFPQHNWMHKPCFMANVYLISAIQRH